VVGIKGCLDIGLWNTGGGDIASDDGSWNSQALQGCGTAASQSQEGAALVELARYFGPETSTRTNNKKGTSTQFSHERNRARETCAIAQKRSTNDDVGAGGSDNL
jgi:hypothetical protein